MRKLLLVWLVWLAISCEAKAPQESSCVYTDTKADVASFALVNAPSACSQIASLRCDQYIYSPVVVDGQRELHLCEKISDQEECFSLTSFNYNTSHLITTDNAEAFASGGSYNFSYFSCYIRSSSGGKPELISEDSTLAGAVTAARAKCLGGGQ